MWSEFPRGTASTRGGTPFNLVLWACSSPEWLKRNAVWRYAAAGQSLSAGRRAINQSLFFFFKEKVIFLKKKKRLAGKKWNGGKKLRWKASVISLMLHWSSYEEWAQTWWKRKEKKNPVHLHLLRMFVRMGIRGVRHFLSALPSSEIWLLSKWFW